MNPSKTYRIDVLVRSEFVPEQSNVAEDRFVFAYHVTLVNTGTGTAQLISRHWIIADGNGHVEEVRGFGVVGQQPVLHPGQKYEYSSGCTLSSPVGTMRGSYQMLADDGSRFEAPIDEFSLVMPRVLH